MGKPKRKGGAKGSLTPAAPPPVVEEEEEEEREREEGEDGAAEDEEDGGSGKKETRGQMVQRHKREQRDLKTKTSGMLHSYNKNDKKAKQQTMEAIKKLEDDLKKRQDDELKGLDNEKKEKEKEVEVEVEAKSSSTGGDGNNKPPAKQGGKTQKKKAKKAAKEAALRAKIEDEKRNTVSERQVELTQIQRTLKPLKLKIVEIGADGDCLYNSVSHQLRLQKYSESPELLSGGIEKLREQVAQHMQQHEDEFLPFYDTDEDDLSAAFKRYCNTVAKTHAWGGQLELKALAHLFHRHIVVHNATAPPVEMGEEFKTSDSTPLHLTYHKHYYALGAHYNSAVPDDGEDEGEGEGAAATATTTTTSET